MRSANEALSDKVEFDPKGEFAAEGEVSGEEELPPEDSIPDLPENQAARNFLKQAPRKGLHMPLGKEVKVMQCWRCKAFGHRTGDRECPLRLSGNLTTERKRQSREDPMNQYVTDDYEIRRREKYARVEELMLLVEEIRKEEVERKEKKKAKKEHKRNRKRENSNDRRKSSS